jgi:hypothetical protein
MTFWPASFTDLGGERRISPADYGGKRPDSDVAVPRWDIWPGEGATVVLIFNVLS